MPSQSLGVARHNMASRGFVAAQSLAVWSTTNKDTLITISGAGLIATSDASASAKAVQTDTTITAGQRVYAAFVCTANPSGNAAIGFVNGSYIFGGNVFLGSNANGLGYYLSNGQVSINNVTVATIATAAVGDEVGIAVNRTAGRTWIRVGAGGWNNDIPANQNPVGSVGGIDHSSITGNLFLTGAVYGPSGSVTARFASNSFANAAPSGYSTLP